jgi:hypothetical protein
MITLLAVTVLGMDVGAVLTLLLKAVLALFGTFAVPYLLPKLPALTQKMFDWVHDQAAHVKNQYLSGVLQRLSTLVGQRVLAYENTNIEYLKEAAASGRISADELPRLLAEMKQKLMDEVKKDLSLQGLWTVLLQVFAGDESSLTKYVSSLVETHVAALPPSGLQSPKGGEVAAMAKSAGNVAKVAEPATPVNPQ